MSEELTNLNWLSFALDTVDCITSAKTRKSLVKRKDTSRPTAHFYNDQAIEESKRHCSCLNAKESIELHKAQQAESKRMNSHKIMIHRSMHKRPQCSYSCLITMALKASETSCLPVHLIYKYIEQEFPYFKTAPEGWKNSIRHNLSMNQNFIKVSQNDIPSTKKGFLWAINPSRMETLDQEIDKTLKAMGRRLIENGEENIPTQYSATSQELFSITNLPDAQCLLSDNDAIVDRYSSAGIMSNEQHKTKVNLQTLNSMIGLETRERYTDNSKLAEWNLLSPQRQTSSEAVENLFGISISAEEKFDDIIGFKRLSTAARRNCASLCFDSSLPIRLSSQFNNNINNDVNAFMSSGKEDSQLSSIFSEANSLANEDYQTCCSNSIFDNMLSPAVHNIDRAKSDSCLLYDDAITPVNHSGLGSGGALTLFDSNDFDIDKNHHDVFD